MIKTHKVYYPLYNDKEKFIILVTGGRSSGKCLKKGTKVMMADFRVKRIEDVKAGDKVMGDDGKPRKVLTTSHGYGDLYTIRQKGGMDYTVNEHHILTLMRRRYTTRKRRDKDIVDIPIRKVPKGRDSKGKGHPIYYGIKAKSIPCRRNREMKNDPYLIGMWIHENFPNVEKKEIVDYLREYTESHPEGLKKQLAHDKIGGIKKIPHKYIATDEESRLRLLAGILDCGGTLDEIGFSVEVKGEILADSVKLVADTLGFRTSKSESYIDGRGYIYNIRIDGEIGRIPTKTFSLSKRYGSKDRHRYLPIDVSKDKEQGEWYGIGIDGNHRFLLADGTITHNSFMAGTFIERMTFEMGEDEHGEKIPHNILFTRYTMVSAEISVIPEFKEKIELDGTEEFFKSTKRDVINMSTGARVMFRGIHTSSGNQTAKLKSIHGLTTLVVDEAEEWVSEQEFDTIMLSIRKKGIQNRIIIIMNPTDSNHFIYQRYIKDTHKIVEFDGVPVQISTHPNVLHIHTSYLDNIEHCGEEFIREVEEMKVKNPDKYAHVVMGRWADVAEGAIFKKYGFVDEFPKEATHVALGVDWGFTCFEGNTKILTQRGEIPIKDVMVGDYALTRIGYRYVERVHNNGVKNVITRRLYFDGGTIDITATEEHLFYTNKGWKKFKDLKVGEIIVTSQCLKEECTSDMVGANTQTISIIKPCATEGESVEYCTGMCGKQSGGRFQKDMLFTTLTKTHSTTNSITLCSLQNDSTAYCTAKILRSATRKTKHGKKPVTRKRIGLNAESESLKDLQRRRLRANIAAKSSIEQMYTKGSVVRNVTENGSSLTQRTTQCASARYAERSLPATNSQKHKLAQTNAHIGWHTLTGVKTIKRDRVNVYDLTIDGIHEYFANGVLVHNCDPNAMVKCGIVGNRLYMEEMDYRTALTNSELIHRFREIGLFVYADSADQRLINEISLGGVNIYGAVKGPGSVIAGIQKMLDMELFIVRGASGSYNLENEFRNYTWDKDANGKYINQPIDAYNHCCFTADTMIKTRRGLVNINEVTTNDYVLNSDGWHKVNGVYYNGVVDVADYYLNTDNGSVRVSCTSDHKVKTTEGWKQISELREGDKVYLLKDAEMSESETSSITASNQRREKVYNIEVEDVHEYMANGLLVSNCDAIRYYIIGKILGKCTQPRVLSKSRLGIY